MSTLFNNDDKQSDKKELEAEHKKQMKEVSKSISESAFWMSYCGMQKAIRLKNQDVTESLVKVSYYKNPWLTYRRLINILFEDIGAGDFNVLMFASNFRSAGYSYKSFDDVRNLALKLCNATKSRDADDLMIVAQRGLGNEEQSKIYNDPLQMYKNEKYDKRIVGLVRAASGYLKEEQWKMIPYLVNIERNSEPGIKNNTATTESHKRFYKDIMPFTVLDTHGAHGKRTMSIWAKKMRSSEGSFLEDSNLAGADNLTELLGAYLFAFEGCGCVDEIRMTDSWRTRWQNWHNSVTGGKMTFDDFADVFSEYVNRLSGLRGWAFENIFNDVVDEIILLSKKL